MLVCERPTFVTIPWDFCTHAHTRMSHALDFEFHKHSRMQHGTEYIQAKQNETAGSYMCCWHPNGIIWLQEVLLGAINASMCVQHKQTDLQT